LDLASRPKDRHSAASAPTALLVANPTGDLPGAGKEADSIAKQLVGWHITRLDGENVTRSAVLEGLSNVGLFHYAGHAELQHSQGLASALLLAGNARVELGDLLAAPSVPNLVVLSACDAAGTTAHHPSLIGLAQAFVAAGARAVVAPVRAVSDTAAQAFFGAFYASLASAKDDPDREFGAAFRSAVLDVSRLRDSGESERKDVTGTESFRLLVP
jgi:CHAT domain-containing protein